MRMVASLLAALAMGTDSAPALAQVNSRTGHRDSTAARVVPFGTGERLVYNARFGPMNVGEGSMEVLAPEEIRGATPLHTRFRLRGGVAFYRVNFLLESWFDTTDFSSYRFINEGETGGRTRERRYEIFPDRERYQENQLPETTSVAQPMDEGALLYYVRTMELEVGQTVELQRYFRPDRNPVIIKVLRREKITVPTGTYNTIVIQPIIKTRGMFSEGGQAQIWLSDDRERIILQMRVRLSIGSVTLQLKSYRPPT